LQNCHGSRRVSHGSDTWRAAIGRADAGGDASVWTGVRGPGPPVHRGPNQGLRIPFNLGRRFSIGRLWRHVGDRRRCTGGARRQRAAPRRNIAGVRLNGCSVRQISRDKDQKREGNTRNSLRGLDRRKARRRRRSGGAVELRRWAPAAAALR
jgi:hypothetical protein